MNRTKLLLAGLVAVFPVLAQAENMELELIIIQEGDELRGISYSAASGPHVATVGLTTDTGVATGAIASIHPVYAFSPEGQETQSFYLYSSTVGQKSE